MASIAEILAADDAKKEAEAAAKAEPVAPAANDDKDERICGFIRVAGKPMQVWLPIGATPASLGLRTFRSTRRLIAP